nr:MAG TPA: hypothetical protein [Caudoviricetes sp.]
MGKPIMRDTKFILVSLLVEDTKSLSRACTIRTLGISVNSQFQ